MNGKQNNMQEYETARRKEVNERPTILHQAGLSGNVRNVPKLKIGAQHLPVAAVKMSHFLKGGVHPLIENWVYWSILVE
ncbi:MAG: hypothetical protein ACOY4I_00225 [Bacillota bacterium]